MAKQNIIDQIVLRFSQMGISCQTGNGADISVDCEYLDTAWSTGSRKINYEASIYADEGSNTVLMWEMTKEVGRGFSFGGEGGISNQVGRTLFRKKVSSMVLMAKCMNTPLTLALFPRL